MAVAKNPVLESPYMAPKITGIDATGKHIKSEDFQKKWVVIYFYPRDMTPGCTTQAVEFQSLSEEFEDIDAVIIGVSKDSPEKHARFSDKEGLRFLLISDEKGRLSEDFGVWKEKQNYGRSYMGIERSTFIINPKGEIVAEWKKVKVAGHAKEVLETLKKCKRSVIKPPAVKL